eukprot:gene2043-5113_t
MSKVKVAVRVRPMNSRELQLDSKCVVEMNQNQTRLLGSESLPSMSNIKGEKTFTFDHSFWSFDANDIHFADQEYVYQNLGTGVLENAFKGYNACIFAYGQTGSGKSYTMMGADSDQGLIPRLCTRLFESIDQVAFTNSSEHLSFNVEVSYMEIYNEKVQDLLGDVGSHQSLRVREHKLLGPYVEGLTKLAVRDLNTIIQLMEEGNKSRTVASTKMNSVSSRSHAVFTIFLTQQQFDPLTKHKGQKSSRISLVDLAGSERAGKTGASGDRLREGNNINKSLTTLGLVISSLADASSSRRKSNFIPYRDSVLTWLLKDSLGGNSKTIMVATISPALDNYEETLSTLRIAGSAMSDTDLLARLRENESLMKEMELTWEEKLKMAEEKMKERQRALEALGISVSNQGVAIDKDKYYLVNLNEDPSMTGMLIYHLEKPGTVIGSQRDETAHSIVFSGVGIRPKHALIEISANGEMYIKCLEGAAVTVNGQDISQITNPSRLRHGARVLFGARHYFRVVAPHDPGKEDTASDWQTATSEMLAKEKATIHMIQQAPEDMRELILEKLRGCVDDLRTANSISKELNLPYAFESKIRLSETALTTPGVSSQEFSEVAVVMRHTEYACKRVMNLDVFRSKTIPSLQTHYELYTSGTILPPADSLIEEAVQEVIGVAHIFFEGICHGISINLELPIIDKYGAKAGTLDVGLETFAKNVGIHGADHEQLSPSIESIKVGDVLRVLVHVKKASEIASGISTLAARPKIEALTGSSIEDWPFLTSCQRQSMPTHTHEFEGSFAFAVELTSSVLQRMSSSCLPIVFEGLTHIRPRATLDDGLIGDLQGCNPNTSKRLAEHAALAQRWMYNIGYYKLWCQVLEVNDDGVFSPVYSTTTSDVLCGALFRFRQGSARKLRLTLKHYAGVAVPIVRVSSVEIGQFAILDKQEIAGLSIHDDDTDVLQREYEAILKDHFNSSQLEEQLRQSANDSGNGDLDKSTSIKWQTFLKEKDALFAPEPGSGLPGAGEKFLVREPGFERQMMTSFVSHERSEGAGTRKLENSIQLALEEALIDGQDDCVRITASWNAPEDLGYMHAVTSDRHKVVARVRIYLEIEGAPMPLIIEKLVAFKVAGSQISPKGCGLCLQIINSVPEFVDTEDHSGNAATESLSQMQESCNNLMKMTRVQTTMSVQGRIKELKTKLRRQSMVGVVRSVQPTVNYTSLEKEVAQLQQLVALARQYNYEEGLLHGLVERLTQKQMRLDICGTCAGNDWQYIDRNSPLLTTANARSSATADSTPAKNKNFTSFDISNSPSLSMNSTFAPIPYCSIRNFEHGINTQGIEDEHNVEAENHNETGISSLNIAASPKSGIDSSGGHQQQHALPQFDQESNRKVTSSTALPLYSTSTTPSSLQEFTLKEFIVEEEALQESTETAGDCEKAGRARKIDTQDNSRPSYTDTAPEKNLHLHTKRVHQYESVVSHPNVASYSNSTGMRDCETEVKVDDSDAGTTGLSQQSVTTMTTFGLSDGKQHLVTSINTSETCNADDLTLGFHQNPVTSDVQKLQSDVEQLLLSKNNHEPGSDSSNFMSSHTVCNTVEVEQDAILIIDHKDERMIRDNSLTRYMNTKDNLESHGFNCNLRSAVTDDSKNFKLNTTQGELTKYSCNDYQNDEQREENSKEQSSGETSNDERWEEDEELEDSKPNYEEYGTQVKREKIKIETTNNKSVGYLDGKISMDVNDDDDYTRCFEASKMPDAAQTVAANMDELERINTEDKNSHRQSVKASTTVRSDRSNVKQGVTKNLLAIRQCLQSVGPQRALTTKELKTSSRPSSSHKNLSNSKAASKTLSNMPQSATASSKSNLRGTASISSKVGKISSKSAQTKSVNPSMVGKVEKEKSTKKKKSKPSRWAQVNQMPVVDFKVGDCVIVENSHQGPSQAIVHYMGMVSFGDGPWVGVELQDRPGKHDGTKENVRYFTCPPGTGMFVRPDKVKILSPHS